MWNRVQPRPGRPVAGNRLAYTRDLHEARTAAPLAVIMLRTVC
jgi:hypothetical protein